MFGTQKKGARNKLRKASLDEKAKIASPTYPSLEPLEVKKALLTCYYEPHHAISVRTVIKMGNQSTSVDKIYRSTLSHLIRSVLHINFSTRLCKLTKTNVSQRRRVTATDVMLRLRKLCSSMCDGHFETSFRQPRELCENDQIM